MSRQLPLSTPPTDDTALNTHIVFFDVDGDGTLTRAEIQTALGELGFSPLTSRVLAPVLAIALPSEVSALREVRHDDTGAFDRDGHWHEPTFDAWWQSTDRDGDGSLTRWELLLGSVELANDPTSLVASVAEFQLLYSLLAEDGGLTRSAVVAFLNGELFKSLIAKRSEPKG